MKKIFIAFVSIVLIISSCKLKEDTTGSDTSTTPSTVTVVKPNGGEAISEGSSYEIDWTGTGMVRIQLSMDNGSTWSSVVDSLKATGVYTWFPVPNQISNQCLVRVSTVDGTSADASDKVFSIIRNSNKSISINSPKKTDQWEAGTSNPIKWISSGIDSVKIDYTTDNGNHWNFISVDKKNTGIYYWEPIPNTPSTLAKIRIIDAKGGVTSAESDLFSILPEQILKVTTPNGGETILAGTSRTIQWKSANIENVKLAYTTNNGFNWTTIIESTPSLGYYAWNPVPSLNSKLCKIRVYDAKDGQPNAVSDSTFTITNQITKTIELQYPIGGEKFRAGETPTIKWTSSGITKVNLLFTKNNWITTDTIIARTDDVGSYDKWTVPDLGYTASSCKIRVTDVSGDPRSESKSTFTITPKPNIWDITPNSGASWVAGVVDTIRWKSIGVDNVFLEFTADNGKSWNQIVTKTAANGLNGKYPYSFSTAGTQFRIHVVDADYKSPEATSSGTFTVTPEPKINVVSPNGTEEWFSGSSNNIKWTSTNIENVKIEYTTNNGASWNVITASTPSNGLYAWSTIPNVSSLQCRIRVSDAVDGIPSDVSDDNFTITSQGTKLIKVKTPNGGEVWPAGTSQNITWDAAGITNVKIEFTSNNGNNWNTIIASAPNTGFYSWTQVPTGPSTICKVRISDVSAGGPSDDSDAFFTISPAASISIIAPNGNDTWLKGTNREIKWTSLNVVNVKIEYTTNSGGNWNTIINSTPSTGSYIWQNIPDANNSLQCRIRISEAVYGTPSTISADNFAIMSPGAQQVKVVSPNNGEKWNVGSMQNIIWDAGGIANVKLEYTTNNGLNWITIIPSTPSNGYYTWNPIPNTPATNCKVRISDADDNDPTDMSDNFFSILPAPSIKVISPNGGETIQSGTNSEIRWVSENVLNVKIEYTTNGGAVWNVITNSVESTGSYIWTNVPSLNSLQCKIRVSDASNGSSSDVSDNNFAISNATIKSLKLSSPNGGESWEAGTIQNIIWTTSGVNKVKIELTTDQGSNWTVLADSVAGGAYQWSIDATLNSIQCQIRISDPHTTGVSSISASTFTISPKKSIIVTGPISKVYKSNEPVTITWQATGIKYIGIKYTTTNGVADANNAAFTVLTGSEAAASGTYSTYFSKPSSQYFVVVYNADEGSNGTPSNNSPGFTIESANASTINIISPVGGEQWLANPKDVAITDVQKYHPYEIRWNGTSLNKVKIEWSSNGGGTWYIVPGAQATENDGSFTWAPGRLDSVRPDSSDNCKIRISSADANMSVSAQTGGFFSVHESKKLRIDSPNGGEYFYLTAAEMLDPKPSNHWPLPIYWTSYAISGNINIYYSIQNGADGTWIQLVLNYPSTGSYAWDFVFGANAEPTSSSLLRFKIIDAADSKVWDSNDGPLHLHIIKGN